MVGETSENKREISKSTPQKVRITTREFLKLGLLGISSAVGALILNKFTEKPISELGELLGESDIESYGDPQLRSACEQILGYAPLVDFYFGNHFITSRLLSFIKKFGANSIIFGEILADGLSDIAKKIPPEKYEVPLFQKVVNKLSGEGGSDAEIQMQYEAMLHLSEAGVDIVATDVSSGDAFHYDYYKSMIDGTEQVKLKPGHIFLVGLGSLLAYGLVREKQQIQQQEGEKKQKDRLMESIRAIFAGVGAAISAIGTVLQLRQHIHTWDDFPINPGDDLVSIEKMIQNLQQNNELFGRMERIVRMRNLFFAQSAWHTLATKSRLIAQTQMTFPFIAYYGSLHIGMKELFLKGPDYLQQEITNYAQDLITFVHENVSDQQKYASNKDAIGSAALCIVQLFGYPLNLERVEKTGVLLEPKVVPESPHSILQNELMKRLRKLTAQGETSSESEMIHQIIKSSMYGYANLETEQFFNMNELSPDSLRQVDVVVKNEPNLSFSLLPESVTTKSGFFGFAGYAEYRGKVHLLERSYELDQAGERLRILENANIGRKVTINGDIENKVASRFKQGYVQYRKAAQSTEQSLGHLPDKVRVAVFDNTLDSFQGFEVWNADNFISILNDYNPEKFEAYVQENMEDSVINNETIPEFVMIKKSDV